MLLGPEGRSFPSKHTPVVRVGKVLEITSEERRGLLECAREMELVARTGPKGWLLRYFKAHKEGMRLIQTIIRRSHAN